MDLSQARGIFFDEASELCDALENALLDRAQYPATLETYNLMFRTAHTIKGSAGIFGLEALVRFAHTMENVLEDLRGGRLGLDDKLTSLLLKCNDHLRLLLSNCKEDESRAAQDLPGGEALLDGLRAYQAGALAVPAQEGGAPQADGPLAQSACWQLSLRFHADLYQEGYDPYAFLRYLGTMGTACHIEPVWRAWPSLAELDPTECFLGLEISFQSSESREQIASAFEFIENDSLIGILPPHAPLQDYCALARRLGEPFEAQIARWQARGALTEVEAEYVRASLLGEASPNTCEADTAPAAAGTAQLPPMRMSARTEGQFIRIEAAKLDRLINRVGELVIASSGTTMLAQRREDAELQESVAIINTLVESIRDDALTLRMVPVNDIFGRFPRMVREVSEQLGKSIQLEIRGADTEIDKSMVEKLNDPLMHIVRNAVDHGLESPEERVALGKPEVGTITLNAYHDAGSVVVEVRDDGRGINRDKVLAKAIERGLVPEGRVFSDQEILQLIFQPGFSTAETVSDLSGRGVGMDVVKRNIEALRGEVEIQSKVGEGSRFRLRLPLTLAIIDGFLVEMNDSALVMPLDMMIECVDLPPDRMAQPTRQINVRGDWLPFVSLRELFDLPPASGPEFVVIVNYGEQRAGIVVDRLLGEVQTVIKPLGDLFRSLRGISGATILGSGKPALILDVPQLIQHAWRREKHMIRQQTQALVLEHP